MAVLFKEPMSHLEDLVAKLNLILWACGGAIGTWGQSSATEAAPSYRDRLECSRP